ncbi:MAG: hypothetical protein AABX50_00105 [Nanoarchaeota archaeon]
MDGTSGHGDGTDHRKELERRGLIRRLKPGDVIRYKTLGQDTYLIVEMVRDGYIHGQELSHRRVSVDELIRRDFSVAS